MIWSTTTVSRIRILVVDDEPGQRLTISKLLESHGYQVDQAPSCAGALDEARASRPDLAVVDYLLPDGTALDLLPRLREMVAELPVVILTAHGSIDLAVRAIKEGADQFLTKPVEFPTLLVIVQRLLESYRDRQKLQASRTRQARERFDPFPGAIPLIRTLEADARRVAASDSPVLIHGETGTGKTILARWLHENGPRAEESFVDLNCSTLSKEFLETELFGHEKGSFTGAIGSKPGLLEVAHRGTAFLDEIGDIDVHVQPKLLKVLEEKRYRRLGAVADRFTDIRLIAASHQDLTELVRNKAFRGDLYFRISTIPLTVPPLRERVDDIPVIARILLDRLAADIGRSELTLSQGAEKALREYSWPGNIRELRNVLERGAILSERNMLVPSDLRFESQPAHGFATLDTSLSLAENERRYVETVLAEENGRVETAARRLGLSRNSLYLKIKKHGIVLSRRAAT